MRIPWPKHKAGTVAKPAPLSTDSLELRLIAKRAGLEPTRLAAWLADPQQPLTHLTASELKRLGASFARIRTQKASAERSAFVAVWPQISAAIDIAVAHHQEEKPKEN